MKIQILNLAEQRNSNTPIAADTKLAKEATGFSSNLDNRDCYKERREELNRRVKGIIEQKQQILNL